MNQESRGEQDDLGPDTVQHEEKCHRNRGMFQDLKLVFFQDTWEPPRRRYDEEDDEEEEGNDDDEIVDEVDRDVEEDLDGAENRWDKDKEEGNEVNPEDGLQDLQYFPNFYRLLKSLDSGKNS